MNKKNIFYWALYDFANSITVSVFFLYFSQWLVVENSVTDFWYNMIFIGASVLLLTTAPAAASIADKKGVRLPYLRTVTLLQIVFLLGTSLTALLLPLNYLTILIAGACYLFANYFYQFAFVYYHSMLPSLAPEDKRGWVSGLGEAANWLGFMFGLIVTMPLANGKIYLFGHSGRPQTFLPATILFALLSLPMIFLFKEQLQPKVSTSRLKAEYKDFWNSFKNFLKEPGVGRFLLGFFLFNDAIVTLENNTPIYMERLYGVSDTYKSLIVIGTLITSIIGSLALGKIADNVGLKKTLMVILIAMSVLLPLMGLSPSVIIFAVLMMLVGAFYGGLWTVCRAVLSYLAPQGRLNYAFSFYALAERFATLVGPLSWGLITTYMFKADLVRYRIAMVFLSFFVFLGWLVAKKIPAARAVKLAENNI